MKVKIDLSSAKIGEVEIISGPAEESKFQVSNFHLSVYEMPTLEVIFPVEEPQRQLLDLEKGDKISLSFCQSGSENFLTKFVGEIDTQQYNLNEDRTRTLEVKAVSPFMRLEEISVNQDFISDCRGLRQILSRLMEIGGVWGEIIIDDDVRDDVEIGFVYEYPALSLLKQILFQRDLIFDFDRGDILRISTRRSSHERAMANITTITEDQIISMKFNK